MAIPIASIKEKCCDSNLTEFKIIDGDSLDINNSTCDKIIECSNKYILIEEKSLYLGFFDNCCREVGQSLETYKVDVDGVIYLKISDLIALARTLNMETKKRIFHQTIANLLSSSLKKASHTTHLLATKFNIAKTADMPILYLYCDSKTPADILMHILVSTLHKKTPFIVCERLKLKLIEDCC